MINPDLQQYIKVKRAAGIADDLIKKELLAINWPQEVLDEAFGVKVTKVLSGTVHYLGIGELLSESFKLFVDKFVSAFLLLLIPSVMVSGVAILLSFMIYSITGIDSPFFANSSYSSAAFILVMIVTVLVFVMLIVFQTWASTALTFYLLSDRKVKRIEAFILSWKFVRSFWWISVLELLILSSGFALLIIPGIILGIWFIFSQMVLVDEEIRGLDALQTSREYARGYEFSIFLRMLLLIVLFVCIEVPFGIFTTLFKLEKNIIVTILNSVLSMGVAIFVLSYLVTMYKNIKGVKAGSVEIYGKSKVGYIILAVLGIICFMGIPVAGLLIAIDPMKQIGKAKEAQSRVYVQEIQKSVMLYYAEKNQVPTNLDQLVPDYLKSLPVNPDEKSCYSVSINKALGNVLVESTPKVGGVCATEIAVK